MLSVSFSSESLEQAEEAKEVFSIKDSNDKEIALKYYDNSKAMLKTKMQMQISLMTRIKSREQL